MFVVSETSKLRVYVNVPQNYVPNVPVGTKAQISVPEYPGRTFPATIEKSAQSVDIASNATRIQLVVDNSQGELLTGDFTNVNFELPHPEVAVNVPASALIFNKSGLHVATVDSDVRIVLKKVTIARDLSFGPDAKDVLSTDRPEGPHYFWSTELPIRRQAESALKKIESTLPAPPVDTLALCASCTRSEMINAEAATDETRMEHGQRLVSH